MSCEVQISFSRFRYTRCEMLPRNREILLLTLFAGFVAWTKADQWHFESLEMLNGSENYFRGNFTVERKNQFEYLGTGFLTLLVPLDNSYTLRVKHSIASKKDPPDNRRYESSPFFEFEEHLCDYMADRYKQFFYEKLEDKSHVPHYTDCPLEPADFWFKDWTFSTGSTGEGHWMIEVSLTKERKEVLAGIIYKFELVEE